jgi:hypothetical protein
VEISCKWMIKRDFGPVLVGISVQTIEIHSILIRQHIVVSAIHAM